MKTDQTQQLERSIFNATVRQGVFGCFEVTIGWFGSERVDYMTYDTNGNWRCYEIKVSKSDFHSKNHNTFIGNYNYYVMPQELYEAVKPEISPEIGIFTDKGGLVKKAKRQKLKVDEQTMKNSMIRSLAREFESKERNGDPDIIKRYKREAERCRAEARECRRAYLDARKELYEMKHPERAERRRIEP